MVRRINIFLWLVVFFYLIYAMVMEGPTAKMIRPDGAGNPRRHSPDYRASPAEENKWTGLYGQPRFLAGHSAFF